MWFNPIIIWLLRSPFHGFVSKNIMLISYTGRKSGKKYTTPVNYLQMVQGSDQFLAITSIRNRIWWRNLRNRAPFSIRFQGKDYEAYADVFEDKHQVTENLSYYFRQWPEVVKYFSVGLDAQNQPILEDIAKAAETRVFLKAHLA